MNRKRETQSPIRYQLLNFFPDIRVFAPIIKIWPDVQNRASVFTQRVWSESKLDCGVKYKYLNFGASSRLVFHAAG